MFYVGYVVVWFIRIRLGNIKERLMSFGKLGWGCEMLKEVWFGSVIFVEVGWFIRMRLRNVERFEEIWKDWQFDISWGERMKKSCLFYFVSCKLTRIRFVHSCVFWKCWKCHIKYHVKWHVKCHVECHVESHVKSNVLTDSKFWI